jgi:hypothetical protein
MDKSINKVKQGSQSATGNGSSAVKRTRFLPSLKGWEWVSALWYL